MRALAARVDGEIRFDPGSRAAYAHDSSNYQQPPIGVVVPRGVEAGAEPGACLDDLNAELSPHGLMVGPKPSTHDTCTIGG